MRWDIKEDLATDDIRDLFAGTSMFVDPADRKCEELRLIRAGIEERRRAFDEQRDHSGHERALEALEVAAIAELGFPKKARAIIRSAVPTALSRKDQGSGGTLTALRVGDNEELLACGDDCDKEVALKVAQGNTAVVVDLQAVGLCMDLMGIERGSDKGGRTAEASGASFHIIEQRESERRQARFGRKRDKRAGLREAPAGAYVEVGNVGHPEARHAGRLRVHARRGSIFGNPFRMGGDGHDESLRALVCACFAEWLDGGDAYEIAARRGLPLACVSPGAGRASKQDVDGELDALIELVVVWDERILLECACAPSMCHLDMVAGILNGRIQAQLDERDEHSSCGAVGGAG